MEAREHTQGNLQLLREQLDSGRMRSARVMVHSLHPAEIARLLESLPLQERAVLWEMVSADDEGDVLVELSDEVRDGLIEGMQTEELIAATAGMDFDDLADLLADLPEAVTRQVLQSLDKLDHDRLQQVLAYDEDCAGGLMNIDIVTVRPDVTLEVVMRYLRAVGDMPDGTDLLFVVNRDNEYVGSLFLSRLLTHDSDTLVSSIMSTDVL
ncbi:MAG: magnesium transporter, partial [Gammaproteobacteria bacterium]|nr:magnesium transporter [Gammaproteobacteria bacterium]